MEEHSRRRGAQQGAEGRPAGRVVGAVFLMTISWAVSPHPHRVAHFKYHEIVPKSKISWYICDVLGKGGRKHHTFTMYGLK